MKIRIAILAAALALPFAWAAEEKPPAEKKLDSLLVHGEGFLFSVKEPDGWVADTENAEEIGANIIFYPVGQKGKNGKALIRVLVAKKVDEDTAADLAHDIAGYKSQFPKIKFEDITVTHPSYKLFPKLFTVPDEFYEYVVYLNPGPKTKQILSASMNKQKAPATKEEFDAYQKIISSLVLLSGEAHSSKTDHAGKRKKKEDD